MHFVLVHGAWHGGWCWEYLVPELHARHLDCSVVDLPGHGDDSTPRDTVDLNAYVERVAMCVRELDRPVELVGHSMAGAVITRVAEALPGFLSGLIYLCAFMPRNGETLAQLAAEDSASALHGTLHAGPEPDTLVVDPEAAREIFYHDCRGEDADAAIARLGPQPLAPLRDPVLSTHAGFGSVPRSYIVCTDDRAITAAMQRRMIAQLPCDPVVELASGHSPFYANPAALAEAMEAIARSR